MAKKLIDISAEQISQALKKMSIKSEILNGLKDEYKIKVNQSPEGHKNKK